MRVYPLFLQGFKSDEIAKSLNSSNLIETYNENIQFDGYISHVERDRKNEINLIFIRISVPFVLVSSILDERNGNIRKISTLKFATGDLFDLKAFENRYWTCNRPLWDLCLSNPFLGVEIGLRRERERERYSTFEYPSKFHQLFAISSSNYFPDISKALLTFHVTSLPESLLKKKKKIFERTFSKKWLSFIHANSWFLSNKVGVKCCVWLSDWFPQMCT